MNQETEILQFLHYNQKATRTEIGPALSNASRCHISFRTVDLIDYEKAMLMFYELNIIAAFKRIFIEQFLFAIKTYF